MLLPDSTNHKMQLAAPGTAPVVRQLTPPESPPPSDPNVLPPIQPTTGKMSLDFIAPSCRSPSPRDAQPRAVLPRLEVLSEAAAMHRGSRPSSPFQLSGPTSASFTPLNTSTYMRPQPAKEEYYTPVSSHSGGLPSPTLSLYSEPLHGRQRHGSQFNPSYQERRPPHHAYRQPLVSRSPPLYTPHGARPSRIQKRSIPTVQTVAPSRAERHPYDPEEKFALIYWRRHVRDKKLEWKHCLDRFQFLFPANTPRRWKPRDTSIIRGLPELYPERNIQGLQCRFYRVRNEEGMPKTRATGACGVDTPESQAAADLEMQKLHEMAVRHQLHPEFVRRVEQLAAKGEMEDVVYGVARL